MFGSHFPQQRGLGCEEGAVHRASLGSGGCPGEPEKADSLEVMVHRERLSSSEGEGAASLALLKGQSKDEKVGR